MAMGLVGTSFILPSNNSLPITWMSIPVKWIANMLAHPRYGELWGYIQALGMCFQKTSAKQKELFGNQTNINRCFSQYPGTYPQFNILSQHHLTSFNIWFDLSFPERISDQSRCFRRRFSQGDDPFTAPSEAEAWNGTWIRGIIPSQTFQVSELFYKLARYLVIQLFFIDLDINIFI